MTEKNEGSFHALRTQLQEAASAFAGAAPELQTLEEELFQRVDLVFTGGRSLYEAKRARREAKNTAV